jgi:MFS family permease
VEVAASTITGVVIKLPAGALSDVLGRKRMMLLGCLFFAGPPFLYPFVHSTGALLALRFPHGCATAIFGTIWDREEASGPILAGMVITTLSYSPAFAMMAALMAVVALIFAVCVRESQMVHESI